jgi:hypothetical protein
MYRDDRVLRVMLVADSSGTFIEWLERSWPVTSRVAQQRTIESHI